jgi:hypothetical protein
MAEILSNYYVGSLFQSDHKKKNREIDNKMIQNLTQTQQFMQKRGLNPDSMCFFCNQDEETKPHILVFPYFKENQTEICYNKTWKKLKVKSEEEKRKIHSIITSMISGPQDNETKEKFKHQSKRGWDKVIRGFLKKWQAKISQSSETIKSPEDYCKIIMMVWET